MYSSQISIKPVFELQRLRFRVPAYQRGYRWTEQEVIDFLEDVNGFTPKEIKNSKEKTWYCLQPLVVKLRKDGDYEVIDGQQRLTTVYLIGHYINEMWRGKEKDQELCLCYETRDSMPDLLKSLHVNENGTIDIDSANIDHYHITLAYNTIHEWVQSKQGFIKDTFMGVFLNYVKVIWFEVNDALNDSIEIFTRINMGKIPLTNAELVKALFLNGSNFHDCDSRTMELRQMEIAGEWDRIESRLHSSDFWYFIANENSTSGKVIELETRIDYILSIVMQPSLSNDPYSVFRRYSKELKDNNTYSNIMLMWHDIIRCYQTLDEWFSNHTLYHLVGFLIHINVKVDELYNNARILSKSAFRDYVNAMIRSRMPKNEITDLEYGNDKVRSVLLLHNILTMLSNNAVGGRFPFDLFKKEKWDVEHIHSVNSQMPVKESDKREWLKNARKYTNNMKVRYAIEQLLNNTTWNDVDFLTLSNLVLQEYSSGGDHTDINDLSNLALLDAGTNRSYKNAIYPVKRSIIIDRDKKGVFIPICTRNAFVKYYSKDVESYTIWSAEDGDAYLKDIESVLGDYTGNSIERTDDECI